MKWVILISLLCLVSFAELKNLPRRYRHTDDHQLPLNCLFALSNNELAGLFLYQKTKRYPHASAVLLLDAPRSSENILNTCCLIENKDACIEEKVTEAKKKFREIIDEHENTCFNLEKYGNMALYALKIIETTEKFINANLETITNIAKDIVHIYEELCKGHFLEALLYKIVLVEFVCKNQNGISYNLHQCCVLYLTERPKCFANLKNDARFHDLPPTFGKILKETEACKSNAENTDEHKENFLFTLTRNHPELSKLLIMEILYIYEELLHECCQLEDHVQCLLTGEEQIKLHITKITEVVKNKCNNYKQIGGYFFQNEYLIKYSKIIPKAPTSYLIEFTKKMAKVAEKCCNLDSDQQVSCALENIDKVIGSVCRYNEEYFTNKQVSNCCNFLFINRWECINNLGPDPSYIAPPFKPKTLDAPENLCSPNEDTVLDNKQGFLSDLIKSKPNITDRVLAITTLAFYELQTDCCAAENKKECFDTKGQKLVEQIQNDHIIE